MQLVLISRLKEMAFNNDNFSYCVIAQYLLSQANEDFKSLTIFKLAKKTNVSPATITRFCQSMKLKGFKELLFLLQNNSPELNETKNIELNLNSYTQKIALFGQNTISVIEKTLEDNIEKLDFLKEEMEKAKKIYFYGLDDNSLLIKNLSRYLIQFDYTIIYSTSVKQQLCYVNNMTKEDLAVLVSLTLTDNMFKTVKNVAQNLETPLIYITANATAAILNDVTPNSIFEIAKSEGLIGKRFASELGIMFFLKLALLNIAEDEHGINNLANTF